jgi:hypothetical protein
VILLPQPHIRLLKANRIHNSCKRIATRMMEEDRDKLYAKEKASVLRQLMEVKTGSRLYDLGELQTKILDILIKKAKAAKTFDDLMDIHTKTCNLGLDKK